MERAWMRHGWKLVAACAIAVTAGCGQQGPDSGAAPKERPTASISSQQRSSAPAEGRGKEALAHQPAARPIESPPPPPVIAPVAMTAKQLRTCLVKVGNPLPDGELPLADGKAVPVRSLLGKRGTVVLFWNAQNAYALQALADLQTEVNEPYGGHGIAVIGINVQDSPEDARKSIADAGSRYPSLFDRDGHYFAKVATEQLPRLYLVDSQGKVLWFDIEYSTTTRRQLTEAVHVLAGNRP
ncbi:MAG: TlpA family protein disulfide reductase [Thermoguttaceae bacterium]